MHLGKFYLAEEKRKKNYVMHVYNLAWMAPEIMLNIYDHFNRVFSTVCSVDHAVYTVAFYVPGRSQVSSRMWVKLNHNYALHSDPMACTRTHEKSMAVTN